MDTFGVYMMRRWFPEQGEQDAIVWTYTSSGRIVNRKYRPLIHKHPMLQEKAALPTLFNVDAITSHDVVWWVEGEPDVMAIHEAGYPQCVSLKDGAGAKRADAPRDEDKRFAALDTHSDLLAKIQRFVLAGDMDEPGVALREELARRLGRHRCWLVTWPNGCKDACDALRVHGAEGVRQAVEAAEPYPIEGVQQVRSGTLLHLRHSPPPAVLTTGTHPTDAILKLPGEGKLIVVTGIPNHGKSSWVTFVMIHLMKTHTRRFAVFSPEMMPWEQYVAQCAAVLSGKPFWPSPGEETMTDDEIHRAERWFWDRLALLVPDSEDQAPTLDWVLERARATVLRLGATDLVVDPWNEVEHDRGPMTEGEYIGRSLQRLRAFASRHGVNVWIVAHPIKQFPAKPGEAVAAPGLYEISGSANWANKADIGITVHTVNGTTEIHLTKSRFSRWGRKGTMAKLDFDSLTGRYRDPISCPAYAT